MDGQTPPPVSQYVTRSEFGDLVHRIEQAEARLNRGDTSLALIELRLKNIENQITSLADDIKSIKDKPGKRWEQVVSQVLSWAVAILLGFIAIKIA